MVTFRRILYNIFWESIELLVAFSAVTSGLLIVLNQKAFEPSAILQLSEIVRTWWGISLLTGGVLNGWGILVSNLYIRRAGLALLCGASTTLAIAIIATLESNRFLNALTYILGACMLGLRYVALGRIDKALAVVVQIERSQEQ